MSEMRQDDPRLALQYLAEVANTYSETLKPVVKAPFIRQINDCLKAVNTEREQLHERIATLKEDVNELISRPDCEADKTED